MALALPGSSRSLVTIIVGLVVLVVIGIGGWYAYDYFSFLQLKSKAKSLVEAGSFQEALGLLDAIVRKEGETELNLEMYAKCYLGLNQPERARQYVGALTMRFPANVGGHLMAGEIHFMLNDPQSALRSFQDALQISPSGAQRVQALVGMGKTTLSLGQADKSEQTNWWMQADSNLTQALDLDQGNVDANRWMAELKLEQGRTNPALLADAQRFAETALGQLRTDAQLLRVAGNIYLLQGNLDLAEETLNKAIAIRRDDAHIHHDLGVVHFRKHNLTKASEHLGTAVKQQKSAQFLLDFAACKAMEEDWTAVKELLQAALELGQNDVLPWLRLALAAYHNKEEDAAMQNMAQAVERARASAPLHFEYACLGYQNAQNELAESQFSLAVQYDPTDARAQFNIGTIYLLLANYSGAERHLTQAVNLAGSDRDLLLDARLNLGMVYFNSARPQRAVDEFAGVLQLDPDNVWGHINYGVGLALQGNTEEAVQHFSRAIQLSPDAFEAYLNLGLLYSSNDEFEKALATLQQAMPIAPTDTDRERVAMSLGLVYYRNGDLDKAESEFNALLSSKSRVTAQRAKNGLVCVALAKGNNAVADRHLSELLSSPDTKDRERVLLNQAILLASEQQYKKAAEALETALAQDPRLALAYYNRGTMRYASGAFDAKTVQDFQRAYRENPRLAEAHYNLALTYEKQRESSLAEQEYRKALAVHERYTDALINLALLRVRTGGDAGELLGRAREISPDEPRVALVEAYQAVLAGDFAAAIEAGQRAVARDKTLQQAYALLGYAYLRRDQLAEAQQALVRAIELDNRDATSRLNYGRLLHALDQLNDAEEQLAAARDLEPDRVDIYRALVALYLDMWLYEEALGAVKVAREYAPEDPDLAALEQSISAVMERRRSLPPGGQAGVVESGGQG